MVSQGILSKLQAIHNLAERAGTPEEAAVAAEKLQEMLFRYNLELADLQFNPESPRPVADFEHRKVALSVGTAWRRQLMTGIAKSNFCESIYVKGTAYMYLLGETHNIDAVRMMYKFVHHQIERMAWDLWEEDPEDKFWDMYNGKKTKFVNDFAAGAVSVVIHRLMENKQNMQDTIDGGNALVVLTDESLKEELARLHPNVSTGQLRPVGAEAYREGQRAGHNVSLEKQLGGSRNSLRG